MYILCLLIVVYVLLEYIVCSLGVSQSVPKCFDSDDNLVSSKYCNKHLRPKKQKRKCSMPMCALDYE